MKKLASALFFLIASASFAGEYDREESIIQSRLYTDFPVLEANKKIDVKEIEVDIEKNGKVEIDVEFARGSQVDTKDYKMYADKIAASVNKILDEMNDKKFTLNKIEIDTSGIKNDKEVFRY